MNLLQQGIIYGFLGLIVEVVFTGFYSLWHKNWRASAQTYLWMFWVYLVGGLALKIIHDSISISGNIYLNAALMAALFYVPIIYGIEALSGLLFEKILGRKLWDYGLSKATPMGLINFKYAGWWFILAISFDFLVSFLNKVKGLIINVHV